MSPGELGSGLEIGDPPVIAVCGFKNSGKTTLLETLVPRLRADGLAVAVLKSDAHGIEVDHEGSDSDRLFRAGADVALGGPGESILRLRRRSDEMAGDPLPFLLARNDLILLEGHRSSPWTKLWLDGRDGGEPPATVDSVAIRLGWAVDRADTAYRWIRTEIETAWRSRARFGAVLVGGRSRRMGQPKQLIVHHGMTLSERAVHAIEDHVERTVVAGDGSVPDAIRDLASVPDPPGLGGPMAGILSVLRWANRVTWVVAACDMPRIRPEAVAWLCAQRRPGVWAIMPRSSGGRLEPTLALYEPQAGPLLEAQVERGRWGPRHLAEHPRVISPRPPAELEDAWSNVNGPEQLRDSDRSRI